MNSKELIIESGKTVERFVDVQMVDWPEIAVTAKSFTYDGGGGVTDAAAPIIQISETPDIEEGTMPVFITFPAARWEDFKRMVESALAAHREKFAGPS